MPALPTLAPATDLSALAWVHDELRRSLESAHKAVRRHLKEAEAIGASDVDAVDPAVLRVARAQMHQSVGALELVRLPAPAHVLRASETALARMQQRPQLLTPAAATEIEQASFAVLEFLVRLLARKPVSPLALFPQYRAVQELAAAERIHPSDLWHWEWQWRDLPADATAVPRIPDESTRSAMEAQMLALMRGPNRAAMARMSDLCAGLGATSDGELANLWKLAAGFFEAQAQALLQGDLYAKRSGLRQRPGQVLGDA